MHDVMRVRLLKEGHEDVECIIAVGMDSFFLKTFSGRLLLYKLSQEGARQLFILQQERRFTPRVFKQITTVEPCDLLLCLIESFIHVYSLSSFSLMFIVKKSRGKSLIITFYVFKLI
jgi:DNA-binding IclR family transcriptional regulator